MKLGQYIIVQKTCVTSGPALALHRTAVADWLLVFVALQHTHHSVVLGL